MVVANTNRLMWEKKTFDAAMKKWREGVAMELVIERVRKENHDTPFRRNLDRVVTSLQDVHREWEAEGKYW